jgi:hypothetical protein
LEIIPEGQSRRTLSEFAKLKHEIAVLAVLCCDDTDEAPNFEHLRCASDPSQQRAHSHTQQEDPDHNPLAHTDSSGP